MSSYLVTWEIDIEADSPEEAAREARAIQADHESEALVFEVCKSGGEYCKDVVVVDLSEEFRYE